MILIIIGKNYFLPRPRQLVLPEERAHPSSLEEGSSSNNNNNNNNNREPRRFLPEEKFPCE